MHMHDDASVLEANESESRAMRARSLRELAFHCVSCNAPADMKLDCFSNETNGKNAVLIMVIG
jgi:hypothetical protein